MWEKQSPCWTTQRRSTSSQLDPRSDTPARPIATLARRNSRRSRAKGKQHHKSPHSGSSHYHNLDHNKFTTQAPVSWPWPSITLHRVVSLLLSRSLTTRIIFLLVELITQMVPAIFFILFTLITWPNIYRCRLVYVQSWNIKLCIFSSFHLTWHSLRKNK